MYTEKDLGRLGLSVARDTDEESREKGLQWLLDMDLSEPEEELFTVSGDEYQDAGLSAFEAEIAGRPLVRANVHGDDLANYVDEEIVISSDDSAGGIYLAKDAAAADPTEASPRVELMAIDYSLGHGEPEGGAAGKVVEGADILGLAADDDIGEKYVTFKRVKRDLPAGPVQPAAQPETAINAAGGKPVGVESPGLAPIPGHPAARTGLLTEAPVPTQVADPGNDRVANDSGTGAAAAPASIKDYVASIPDLEDDEAFDRYLLAGEHLAPADADPEELVLELSGDAGQDGIQDEGAIDYHADFLALEGFAGNVSSAIAPVIGQIMEEVSAAVRARLAVLGVEQDAVTVELRLGEDEAAVRQCAAEGFAPVQTIYCELPESLQSLPEAVRDAIYVRLQNTVCNETWNELFDDDFARHVTTVVGAGQDCAAPERGPTTDWSLDEGFGEDIFGEGFNDEFSAQLESRSGSESPDIEEAFSDLSQLDEVEGDFDAGAIPARGVDEGLVLITGGLAQVATEETPAPAESAATVATPLVAEPVLVAEPAIVAETGAARAGDTAAPVFTDAYPQSFIPAYIAFNYTSQSNAEIFADFLDAFIEEGSVEVEKLEHEVGEWEKDVASDALFSRVSRTLHTIKGIAKGVGLHRLGTLVHNFETLLDKMPRPTAGEVQDYFRVVNAWLDAVVRGVEHVAEGRRDIDSELPVPPEQQSASNSASSDDGESVVLDEAAGGAHEAPVSSAGAVTAEAADSAALVPTQPTAADPVRELGEAATVTPRTEAISAALAKKRDKQLADEGAKALAAQQSVRITSEKLDLLLNLTSQVQQLGVRASQSTSRTKRSSAELHARLSSVRTHIRKIADRALLNVNARPGRSTSDLDALEMDQYSELQEAANILREGVEDLADLVDVLSRQNSQLEALLKQQSSVISSISSSIQSARVVPVSRLMPGLRRIVRTVSTDLAKVVSFQVLNETGALDRDHYARLQVILEHMVRNALDHGIESPQERVAVGKPTGGRITIDVRQSGGDYVIRLSDDGRGIDPDAIRQAAYEKGLDVDVDSLTDDEAIRLIFHKGFSTASALSEISGRGVGMDIVLTELQQLGGDVEIRSAVGLGTVFEVRIPSNVSVNGALLVAAGGESYAVPLNGLIAVEQVPVDEFFAAVAQRKTLTLAGMACEATYLGTLCQGVPLPDSGAWNAFVPVIVAGADERYMAIAIDNVEEALELVVRSLGSQFSAVPGLAGAATTAEGEAIIALDLNLLVGSAGANGIAPVAVSQTKAVVPLALVVDDSRTQRMVATSQLESVGIETLTAENGLVAIDLLNGAHRLPDVILLDVEMPVKDGIETLREIRKSSRYGHLPVIMVTSRTGAKHRALASAAGCSAYMGKPFNFAALIKQINELTGFDLQLS